VEASVEYPIGSKVVHPHHGAGTVVSIQEKSIGETSHQYYVIHMQAMDRSHAMDLMVPVRRADELGLRPIARLRRLRTSLAPCCEPPADGEVIKDYRARQAAVTEQLKSGSISEVTSAVRVLYFVNAQRRLGMVDSRLFDRGLNILASELALASDQEISAAREEIETMLAQMLESEEEAEGD
jgi:CarD family transcriptional regulator